MTSSSITNDSETYNEHIKFIKETYKFQDLTDEIYDQASKYGEAFVYVVPYKKAVARLLKQKNNTRAELDIKEHTIITESGNIEMDKLPKEIYIKNRLSDFYNIEQDNINISIQGG